MTLYLVRLPDLKAALIEARSESDLISRIDEVLDPGLCTWEVYRGPVWVTFAPPVAVDIAAEVDGVLRTSNVKVGRIRTKEWPLVAAVGDSETAHEMMDAIMRRAFPNTANVSPGPDERLDTAAIRAAVAEDVVEHDRAINQRGTAMDVESGRLYRTEVRYFRRLPDGAFEPISSRTFVAFAEGDGRIHADPDGSVRVAVVQVPATRGVDVATVSMALRLRVGTGGRISEPHRAAAFVRQLADELSGAAEMRARRNEAVRWQLTTVELDELRRAIRDNFPRVRRIDSSPIEPNGLGR